MGKISNRTVWLLIELPMDYGVYKTTEYRLEHSAYDQGLLEGLDNIWVFYDPRELQKMIDRLESVGIQVREVNV